MVTKQLDHKTDTYCTTKLHCMLHLLSLYKSLEHAIVTSDICVIYNKFTSFKI